VIVNNMPMDDDEKSGRVRDNITMLAEMTDSLCDNVLMRQTSHSLAEQFQIAMSTGYSTLETLRELNQRAQVDTRILLQELVDNIEKTFTWLGTSRNQEKMISETMFVSVDKILVLLETAGSQGDEKLNEALSCLRNGDAEGTVDLF
jgi:UDP-N-acetylglucosamine:LPS N-acetylglucosamine transferase